jgi:hypothetical protein
MATLSLNQITSLLAPYIPSDGTFIPRINQTLERLQNVGTYRDLTVQYSLPVEQGCIRLPADADAVLHAIVDGNPAPVRALWHDLKQIGTAGSNLSWGLIDSGFSPVLRLLEEAEDTFYLVPAAGSATQAPFVTEDSSVIITGNNTIQRYSASTAAEGWEDGDPIVFSTAVTALDSIRFTDLDDSYDIRLVAGDPETTIATVGPGSGSTRYRVFRAPNIAEGAIVHLLCKRAFAPLLSGNDITYMGNINAIKHGLLGTIAEDAGDVERAQVFWGTAFQLLEQEMSSTRGAAQPRINLDPSGTGALTGLTGVM